MEGGEAEGRGVSGTGIGEKLKGRGVFGPWAFGATVDSREKAGAFDDKLPEVDLPNGPLDCGRFIGKPPEPLGGPG